MSNVHVRYIIPCDDTIENSVNNIDFIGVFEAKKLSEIPSKYDFSIVISFEYLTEGNIVPEVTIRLINPKGNFMSKELKLELDAADNANKQERIISVITVRLPNFPINEEGFYRIQVLDGIDIIAEQSILFELGG